MGQRHPLRILLAEDHIINQKVMNLMLERLGYRTDIVSNGLEVIQSFKHRDYDVILMDIQMPELNGIEATQRLRVELIPERQPRIIALTANALGGEREVYLSAGMDDYLSKPVNITAMCAALEKCMPLGMSPKTIDQDSTVQQMNIPESMDPTHLTGSIDIPTLKEYFPYEGDDIQLVIDLAQEFIFDTDQRLVQLNSFIQQGDSKSIEKTAHAIKGASMTFGANIFSELCDAIEKSSKTGNSEIATNDVYQAKAEFDRVRQELPLILKRMLP